MPAEKSSLKFRVKSASRPVRKKLTGRPQIHWSSADSPVKASHTFIFTKQLRRDCRKDAHTVPKLDPKTWWSLKSSHQHYLSSSPYSGE